MMKTGHKDIITALKVLTSSDDIHKVTLFLGKLSNICQCIRVSRVKYKKMGFGKKRLEVLLTIGKPNFKERAFIKRNRKNPKRFMIKKTGEPK